MGGIFYIYIIVLVVVVLSILGYLGLDKKSPLKKGERQ